MKTFLAIYLGSASGQVMADWQAQDEDIRKAREKAGIEAWMKWGQDHAASIVENGGPLGKTKRTDKGGVSDVRNLMSGYTVVRAESHEAAARLFENHPHFTVFPGEAVEVMEVLPIPAR